MRVGTPHGGKKIRSGGGLALLPAIRHSLMLAGLICTNAVRARPSYAVMISHSTPIWRLWNKNSGGGDGWSSISVWLVQDASNAKQKLLKANRFFA